MEDYAQAQGMGFCDLVDVHGVKEVWLWGYHYNDIEPVESNMSMGTNVRDYWTKETHGDISNSYMHHDDLIQCENTYTLYNYSYSSISYPTYVEGATIENHTHQIEQVLNWLDGRHLEPDGDGWEDLLFWGKFVGSDYSYKITKPGCGWTHYPPNGIEDYDWQNADEVSSDCIDWKPDGTGEETIISCGTWGCPADYGRGFKVWWMQSLPGYYNGLMYGGKELRNWWEPIADLDSVLLQYEDKATAETEGLLYTDATPPGELPIANDDVRQLMSNSTINLDIYENDQGNGEIALSEYTEPENGALSVTGNLVEYTSYTDFSGADTFNYTISNSFGSDLATVTITVYKEGDTDGDDLVTVFDYNNLISNFGKDLVVTPVEGLFLDFNNNDQVDLLDYNTLVTNFGT